MAPIGLRHLRVELKKLEEQFLASDEEQLAPNPFPELLFTFSTRTLKLMVMRRASIRLLGTGKDASVGDKTFVCCR